MRHLGGTVQARARWAPAPHGTLIVSIAGSFLLGLIVILTTERLAVLDQCASCSPCRLSRRIHSLSVVLRRDTLPAAADGGLGLALANVLANNAVGLLAACTGVTRPPARLSRRSEPESIV